VKTETGIETDHNKFKHTDDKSLPKGGMVGLMRLHFAHAKLWTFSNSGLERIEYCQQATESRDVLTAPAVT